MLKKGLGPERFKSKLPHSKRVGEWREFTHELVEFTNGLLEELKRPQLEVRSHLEVLDAEHP